MTREKMASVFEFYYDRLINLDPKWAGGLVFVRQFGECEYGENAPPKFELLCHLAWMCRKAVDGFLKTHDWEEFRKAATWLGYVQGELRAMKLYSVRELREHSRTAKTPQFEVEVFSAKPKET